MLKTNKDKTIENQNKTIKEQNNRIDELMKLAQEAIDLNKEMSKTNHDLLDANSSLTTSLKELIFMEDRSFINIVNRLRWFMVNNHIDRSNYNSEIYYLLGFTSMDEFNKYYNKAMKRLTKENKND